jgi:putative addiction module killer protein
MSKTIRTKVFQKWFDGLKDKQLRAIIKSKIRRIEQDGYLGKTKAITGYKNISEIKIDIGKGYRIYFNIYVKNNEVWLLNGGDKSTQKRDIETAMALLEQIEIERKKDNGKDYDYGR